MYLPTSTQRTPRLVLQQSSVTVQSWPYAEQAGAPPEPPAPPDPVLPPEPVAPPEPVLPPEPDAPPDPLAPPEPLLPPEPGDSVLSHVPCDDPGKLMQVSPRQQSDVVVHALPTATHEPPHTKGGVPPAGFGTHGLLQQSAAEAHAVPAGGGPFAAQS
jgi:hypothetical protein